MSYLVLSECENRIGVFPQAVHDLRLALDLLLSRGWALVPGP